MTTQNGTLKSLPSSPCENSSTAMMPMVFCASLPPCPSEMSDAAANCSHWKTPSTARGLASTKVHDMASTSSKARKKPNVGDNTMKAPVVSTPDHTIEAMPALVTP